MLAASRGRRKRSGSMDTQSAGMAQAHDDANLRLVRFFSICLGSLVFVYALLAVRLFLDGNSFELADWALIVLRVLLGAAALVMMLYPAWLARPLEARIGEMGTLFEAGFADASTKEKIRLIVLVPMGSLLLG